MRIGARDLDACQFRKARVLGHLASLIVDQGSASLGIDPIRNGTEAGHGGGLGTGVIHSGQGHEQGATLPRRADGRRIAGTPDQVALPMTGDHAIFDLGRSLVEARPVGNRSPAVGIARTLGLRRWRD